MSLSRGRYKHTGPKMAKLAKLMLNTKENTDVRIMFKTMLRLLTYCLMISKLFLDIADQRSLREDS